MNLYHGTRNETVTAHIGQCWTDDLDAASRYGRRIFGAPGLVVGLAADFAGLVVEEVEVSREDVDRNVWPGDTAASLAALAAAGVDVVTYEDMTPDGTTHQTWRIVSARAAALFAGAVEIEIDEE